MLLIREKGIDFWGVFYGAKLRYFKLATTLPLIPTKSTQIKNAGMFSLTLLHVFLIFSRDLKSYFILVRRQHLKLFKISNYFTLRVYVVVGCCSREQIYPKIGNDWTKAANFAVLTSVQGACVLAQTL